LAGRFLARPDALLILLRRWPVIVPDLLAHPAFPRALVLGLVGGAGLALTAIYSRRGPLIYPVYAALLASLALLLGRYADMSFPERFGAVWGGFLVASAALYLTVSILSDRHRRRLVAEGRLPASALESRLPLRGHAWRLGLLLVVGAIASAGVAYVVS
jgi:hypothetical protein